MCLCFLIFFSARTSSFTNSNSLSRTSLLSILTATFFNDSISWPSFTLQLAPEPSVRNILYFPIYFFTGFLRAADLLLPADALEALEWADEARGTSIFLNY